MEGHALAIAPCLSCKAPFAFDPDRVPSVFIDPATGLPPDLGGDPRAAVRRPVCPLCARRANVERRARGLELIDETDTAADLPHQR